MATKHPLGWSWDERAGAVEQLALLLYAQEHDAPISIEPGIASMKALSQQIQQKYRANAMSILELLGV